MGVNDWGFGVDLSAQNLNDNERNKFVFRDAYSMMLEKLKLKYPKAQIYCVTLFSIYTPTEPVIHFPKVLYGNSIESYNKVIGEVAREYQCEVIDLYADKISIPTIDGSHPNKDGMKILAKLIARGILSGDCLHLDCQTDHQYVQIGGDSHKRVLMCSQCGKIRE